MRSNFAIIVLILTMPLLGCILPEKIMDVELTHDHVFEPVQIEGGINLKISVNVSVHNKGDPGYATILVTVYDEIDAMFTQKTERVHLDSGVKRDVLIVLEKQAPQDADIEAYHVSAIVDKTEPD